MKINHRKISIGLAMALLLTVTAISTLRAETGTCGADNITLPFVDVSGGNIFFCAIAEAWISGLTNGTTPTTFSPSVDVPREQMAALITRTLDQSLKRGSRRAALGRFWTPQTLYDGGVTNVNNSPNGIVCDGEDLWVGGIDAISRVRASDGKLLGTWTNVTQAFNLLVARGRVFAVGQTSPGKLYSIDPNQSPSGVSLVSNTLGAGSRAIAYDGQQIWTANSTDASGSVSIISFTQGGPSVTTVTQGFIRPQGIVFDGANMWVADSGKLKKLDASGAVINTIDLGAGGVRQPIFDGTNIWAPVAGNNAISVVRAATGQVLANLTGNGLDAPVRVAFDGERILVTNLESESVSLWKASDLTPLGFFPLGGIVGGANIAGACSDGISFWVTLSARNQIIRF